MTDDIAQPDTDASIQESSPELTEAQKLFGKTSDDKADLKESAESDEKQGNEAETPDSKDEVGGSDKEADSEESKESDEKQEATQYDDLVLTEGLPDGAEANEALVGRAKEIFVKHKVSAEAAQELVNAYNEAQIDVGNQQQKEWLEVENQWKADLKSDAAIGGDKYDENLELAQKAIRIHGNEALKELFNLTRVGNNVEVIRFCANVGKTLSEDGPLTKGSGSGQRSEAEILFPNTKIK